MAKDVKHKIIETSYNLFREKGFDETTVNDICEACDITKTTFYRYLTSKEDILTYFFDEINDELSGLIVSLASADNYWQQIVAAFDLIIDRMLKMDRALYSQVWISNLKSDKGSFREIPILREIVILLIRKAQESGQVRNLAPAEDLYILCNDICFGCAIKWCLDLNFVDIKTIFEYDTALALLVDPSVRTQNA